MSWNHPAEQRGDFQSITSVPLKLQWSSSCKSNTSGQLWSHIFPGRTTISSQTSDKDVDTRFVTPPLHALMSVDLWWEDRRRRGQKQSCVMVGGLGDRLVQTVSIWPPVWVCVCVHAIKKPAPQTDNSEGPESDWGQLVAAERGGGRRGGSWSQTQLSESKMEGAQNQTAPPSVMTRAGVVSGGKHTHKHSHRCV